jgi:hypothetical protein
MGAARPGSSERSIVEAAGYECCPAANFDAGSTSHPPGSGATRTTASNHMPLPEQYRRQLMESHAAAERESRWDAWREWARVLGEIVFWTLAGLGGIGLALHTFDYQLGRIYWWAGCIVWIAGVSAAVLSAYRRGEERGDW